MSRAFVLVAGLYVFLEPIVTNKGVRQVWMETSMKGSNRNTDKTKDTTNNRAIECSLCAPFWYLLFSFTIFFLLFFFCPIFFFLVFALLIFFSQQGAHKNKPQKIWAQLNKDVAYRKLELCSKKHTKTCGLRNSIFLIEFCKSNFCEPSGVGMK